MKYTILIVEDNLTFAIRLERYLEKWGHHVLGIVSNSEEAIKTIKRTLPDIVLMDIYIQGDLNGVEVVNALEHIDTTFIYMTAEKDEMTLQAAMGSKGSNYLVKPFDMMTLKGAIGFLNKRTNLSKNKKEIKESEEYPTFFIKKGGTRESINTKDLNWIQSEHNYCDLYVSNKKYTLRSSLSKLLEKLPEDKFLRIHKRYAVRVEAVEKILLSERIVLIGDQKIPIGRRFKDELIQRIQNL